MTFPVWMISFMWPVLLSRTDFSSEPSFSMIVSWFLEAGVHDYYIILWTTNGLWFTKLKVQDPTCSRTRGMKRFIGKSAWTKFSIRRLVVPFFAPEFFCFLFFMEKLSINQFFCNFNRERIKNKRIQVQEWCHQSMKLEFGSWTFSYEPFLFFTC